MADNDRLDSAINEAINTRYAPDEYADKYGTEKSVDKVIRETLGDIDGVLSPEDDALNPNTHYNSEEAADFAGGHFA